MTLPSLCVQGLISELRLHRDPQVSPRQCQDEDEDDDDDGVSGHCLARAGGPLLRPPLCSVGGGAQARMRWAFPGSPRMIGTREVFDSCHFGWMLPMITFLTAHNITLGTPR